MAWVASRLDDDEIPIKYQWIVETEDGELTVGFAEEGGMYLGLTEEHAHDLADKLNGYIDEHAIAEANKPIPKPREMN